jgi:putative membrane protein
MARLLVNWFVSAISIWLVGQMIRGVEVESFGTALIAAIAIALVNATVGWLLTLLTLPITILTLGLFLLVINAVLLKISTWFVPGFSVHGFLPALVGSMVLSLLTMLLRYVAFRF